MLDIRRVARSGAILFLTGLSIPAAHAQQKHGAPERCEWRQEGRFVLYCHTESDPITPEEAESDAMMARVGLIHVRQPDWNPVTSLPPGFDETTVDRANTGDVAAMRLTGVFHLSYGTTALAVPWLEKAASAGNADAAHRLAILYRRGHGVPRDDARAVRWFTVAANAGDVEAAHWLGELYLSGGKGLAQDPAQAARWFRPAAEAGDAAAMYRLAMLIPGEAKDWLEHSARGGFTAAADELRRRGLAVPAATPVTPIVLPVDTHEACKALPKNPIGQSPTNPDDQRSAALIMGGMFGDKDGALCWSRRAAFNGSGYAAIDLADAYATGNATRPGSQVLYYSEPDRVFAVRKDDAEAARWYAFAARSKEEFIPGRAMLKLGDMYASGVGVPRNDVEAARLYLQARAMDQFGSAISLADMYRGGFGVVRDDNKAAQALMDEIGGATEGALYGAMLVDGMKPLDDRWTAESIGLAAEDGYVEAMLVYGRMLATGSGGVDKDVGEARRCLALAAQLGQPEAAAELAKLPATDPPHKREDPFLSGKVVPQCRP